MGSLKERLLSVMDRKDHWAWPHFGRPGLTKDQLLVHFRHEYQTYVRDFPVLLARTLGLGPPTDVRAALAENIFEEQTGKLSIGVPHPELFLEMMDGLGYSRAQLETADPPLEPEAIAYRRFLDEVSARPPWQIGAAVLTIFVEGSKNERAEMAGKKEERPLEQVIAEHPMVRVHGCPPDKMKLVRVHKLVEGGHRDDAWSMVIGHVDEQSALAGKIAEAMDQALAGWLAYRDGVARRIGLARS
jgi:pyrroloquinoline quinone (PQQ) biosynthesis protein C